MFVDHTSHIQVQAHGEVPEVPLQVERAGWCEVHQPSGSSLVHEIVQSYPLYEFKSSRIFALKQISFQIIAMVVSNRAPIAEFS